MTIVYTILNDKKHYVTRYEQAASGQYLLTISQTKDAAKDFGSAQVAADIIQHARNPYDRKFVIEQATKDKKRQPTPERDEKIS